LVETAGTDAVRAFLVFLHLLERQAERMRELLLRHAQHHPTHAHTASDMPVNGMGDLAHDGQWPLRSGCGCLFGRASAESHASPGRRGSPFPHAAMADDR